MVRRASINFANSFPWTLLLRGGAASVDFAKARRVSTFDTDGSLLMASKIEQNDFENAVLDFFGT